MRRACSFVIRQQQKHLQLQHRGADVREANVTLSSCVCVCLSVTCVLQTHDVASPGESQPSHMMGAGC